MLKDNPWRNTGISPKFFIFDARCFLLFVPFLLHMASWTFYLSVVAMIGAWVIERRGISPDVALRILRVMLIGKVRPAMDVRTFRRRCWYY